MRARVLAVLIVVLTASPILAQCNLTPVFTDPFRSSILDLAIDGNDLWAATGYGVSLYDRSVDPPAIVAMLPLAGTTRLVRIAGGNVYAASGNTIAVVRKNGRTLQLVRTVDIGTAVNDFVATPAALYVATSKGIAQYNPLDFSSLQITQTPATSLALSNNTLYVAGGTPNIDVYNISPILQKMSTIGAPSNISSVHVNNAIVFASSAVQTYLLVNGAVAGTLPFSLTSLAPLTGDVIFAGSTDRSLRAIDVSQPAAPVDLFRDDLAPSGGTINRVTAIVTAGNRAYVGAGDIGIAGYDLSGFAPPFPLRSLPFTATSIVSLGDNFYAGTGSGITEFGQNLTRKRTWDNKNDVVQDGANGFLLTSSGNSVTLWALNNTSTPTAVGTATFASQIVDAVLVGTVAWAALSDGLIWFSDLAQQQPANGSQGVPANTIARSGPAVAWATPIGTSTLVKYSPDLAASKPIAGTEIPGLGTTPIALSGAVAALQTFRGISIIDFSSDPPVTTVLPQSNDVIAQQLLLSGNRLIEVSGTLLRVWNTQSQTIANQTTLPAAATAMSIAPNSTMLDVATASGVVTVALDRLSLLPAALPSPNANAFYKKVIASATRIGLVDARGVDLYTRSMQYVTSIRSAGLVDTAATDNAIYTLSSKLVLNAYSPAGSLMASAAINETSDTQPVALTPVKNAIWVSTVRCASGSCSKNTIIYNDKLSRTISLTGAIVDLVVSGSRAYALTDTPNELRVIDVSDSAHPSIISSAAVSGNSLAYSSGTIYVLGNGLAAYSEASLAKTADILTATSNPDERIRIDGSCAIVTGRDPSPQMFTLPQFAPATSSATPAPAHTVAVQPGTFFVLTDNSLEIWSTAPLPPLPRKHPAR